MSITKTEAQRLANFVQVIRPEWDYPGLMSAIGNAKTLGSFAAVSVALIRIADDYAVRTPAVLAEPGPHWSGTTTASRKAPASCPDHDTKLIAGICDQCQAQMATGRPDNFADLMQAARGTTED